jgi:mercuric reductase
MLSMTQAPTDDAFELRPGVMMPDWGLVTDPQARQALDASMAAAGRANKWADLSTAEDRVWRAILVGFAYSGAAPATSEVAIAVQMAEAEAVSLLSMLRERDLIVLGPDDTTVTAAYPFCTWETGHRVRLGESVAANALCAIDALGTGAMLERDTLIGSACRSCGAPILIETCEHGHSLRSVTPDGAVVWSGLRYADNCCATSGCEMKTFFCSDEHLEAWRLQADPAGIGFRLSIGEALQVGKAIFVPMLADGTPEVHD